MEIYALNDDFEPVTVDIPYFNLQWNRKYYEAGDFSLQVAADVYDQSWAYIGTAERPELGIVQKFAYTGERDEFVQLSGFFYEKRLDDRVCYPRYIADKPTTEEACRALMQRFAADLPVKLAEPNSPMLGDRTQSDFTDDELGTKLYGILETRELSQRIAYDYASDRLVWSVWQGLDRTQGQSVNTWAVFSSDFGNVEKSEVNRDDSDYKNYAIVAANENDAGVEQTVERIDWTGGGHRREMVVDMRSTKPDEGQSDADFRAALRQEAEEKLLDRQVIEDADVDAGDVGGYMRDYDLGDRCDIIIPRFGLEVEARIVEVSEVFKAEGHTVTLGFGNKRISNTARRAGR